MHEFGRTIPRGERMNLDPDNELLRALDLSNKTEEEIRKMTIERGVIWFLGNQIGTPRLIEDIAEKLDYKSRARARDWQSGLRGNIGLASKTLQRLKSKKGVDYSLYGIWRTNSYMIDTTFENYEARFPKGREQVVKSVNSHIRPLVTYMLEVVNNRPDKSHLNPRIAGNEMELFMIIARKYPKSVSNEELSGLFFTNATRDQTKSTLQEKLNEFNSKSDLNYELVTKRDNFRSKFSYRLKRSK